MQKSDIISILEDMGRKDHLDRHVIDVLKSNYDAIVTSTLAKQNEASECYTHKFQNNM